MACGTRGLIGHHPKKTTFCVSKRRHPRHLFRRIAEKRQLNHLTSRLLKSTAKHLASAVKWCLPRASRTRRCHGCHGCLLFWVRPSAISFEVKWCLPPADAVGGVMVVMVVMVVFSLGRGSIPEVVCSESLRHLPQLKKDNLLRQQKMTPRTPFSANSRKKTTHSSNLTIIKSTAKHLASAVKWCLPRAIRTRRCHGCNGYL